MMRTTLTIPMVLVVLAHAPEARGADTLEPSEHGTFDIEGYMGWEGIGLGRHDRGLVGDVLLGIGILPRFSGYVGATMIADESFAHRATVVNLGLIGTLLDTDHVDVDLSLDGAVSGPSEGGFCIGPTVELNLDARPDLALWGGYVRLGVPLAGIAAEAPVEAVRKTHAIHMGVVAVAGLYVTLREIHQILLEADVLYDLALAKHDRTFDFCGVALGYNVLALDSLEVITQLFVDVPTRGEPVSAGFLVGLIWTICPTSHIGGTQ